MFSAKHRDISPSIILCVRRQNILPNTDKLNDFKGLWNSVILPNITYSLNVDIQRKLNQCKEKTEHLNISEMAAASLIEHYARVKF